MIDAEIRQRLESDLTNEYISSVPQHEEYEFPPKFTKSMHRLIRRQNRPYFKLVDTAAKQVACIIVAVLVLIVTPVSGTALYTKYCLNITDGDEYASITTVSDGALGKDNDVIIPYKITALPDGYELADSVEVEGKFYDWHYVNEETNGVIDLTLGGAYNYGGDMVDNERSVRYTVTEDGIDYYVFDWRAEDHYALVIWVNDNCVFSIYSSLSVDEIFELCRSLEPIE